jgi:archaemetzincin
VLQYHAGQILDQIRTIKPKDAFCLVGYMIADIYPRDEWNFVFGLADPDISTGVFSFARYHESFYGGTKFPDYEGRDNFCQVTFRACAVLVHEIGHLFDLRHCISFKCAMNGSNSLEETAGKPFLFCPHCLRKIVFKIKTTPEALLKSFHQATIDIGEGPFLELAEQLNKLLKAI